MEKFWCVTTFFNPARYQSLLNNYLIFAAALKKQNINLLTVELVFDDGAYQIPDTENVIRLKGHSVLWQKERLINYAVSQLPKECEAFAWLDCDIIFFQDNNWAEMAAEKLQKADIIQVYKKIYYLPPGMKTYTGEKTMSMQSVVWQRSVHKNWLERRKKKELPFSTPGFGWAAKRSVFADIGLYDKNIVGSGDTFLVDCFFDSWAIHGYAMKFNEFMKKDMMAWRDKLVEKKLVYDYLPVDICHLWHGSLKNRQYMDRHDIVLKYNFDPAVDIKLENNVYEWATDKPEMHDAIRQYFFTRQEDTLP